MTEEEKRFQLSEDDNASKGGAASWLIYMVFVIGLILLLVNVL